MNTKNIVLLIGALIALSCSNTEPEFDDYDFQGAYFPYQTPARTLILGDYDLAFNDNDNDYRFEITALMTGVYTNDKERKIYFEVDNTLLNNVANVKALPAEYYTFETVSPVSIPSGSTKGRIQVQLRDAFFKDTLSFGKVNTTNYVIPLVMTKADNLDTLSVGRSFMSNPDRVNPLDWDVLPKDYTLFGIKFMNRFHGNYLRRGNDMITDPTSTVGRVYNAGFVERDELTLLETAGMDKVKYQNLIGRGENSSPTISSYKNDPYGVTGTGQFVEDGDSFGGNKKDVIYLNYTYKDAVNAETHTVKDTLVIRDRTAIFEEFTVELKDL